MGLAARDGFNLTAFDNADAKLHFSMKTSHTGDFQIGFNSGSLNGIGQKWINFKAGNDPYGFVRDGQWHDIVIPMSDATGAWVECNVTGNANTYDLNLRVASKAAGTINVLVDGVKRTTIDVASTGGL